MLLPATQGREQVIKRLNHQHVVEPSKCHMAKGNTESLGNSLPATALSTLTSQRFIMERTINPLQGVTGSAACACTRIFCLCATYVYAHCDMRRRGTETWEIQKTDCSHKSCQVRTSCSFRIFFFLPFSSTFDGFILISNLININNGRRQGQHDSVGCPLRQMTSVDISPPTGADQKLGPVQAEGLSYNHSSKKKKASLHK